MSKDEKYKEILIELMNNFDGNKKEYDVLIICKALGQLLVYLDEIEEQKLQPIFD